MQSRLFLDGGYIGQKQTRYCLLCPNNISQAARSELSALSETNGLIFHLGGDFWWNSSWCRSIWCARDRQRRIIDRTVKVKRGRKCCWGRHCCWAVSYRKRSGQS